MLIQVHVNAPTLSGEAVSYIERAVRVVLDAEGVVVGELSVTLLDDPAIAALHERYLGVDGPTDVLSFDLGSSSGSLLGDIYIGYETAAAHAVALNVDLREELVRLAIHGTLHVLGHDHPVDDRREESPMFLRQESYVARVLGEEDGPGPTTSTDRHGS